MTKISLPLIRHIPDDARESTPNKLASRRPPSHGFQDAGGPRLSFDSMQHENQPVPKTETRLSPFDSSWKQNLNLHNRQKSKTPLQCNQAVEANLHF